jgi:hypothetical protein
MNARAEFKSVSGCQQIRVDDQKTTTCPRNRQSVSAAGRRWSDLLSPQLSNSSNYASLITSSAVSGHQNSADLFSASNTPVGRADIVEEIEASEYKWSCADLQEEKKSMSVLCPPSEDGEPPLNFLNNPMNCVDRAVQLNSSTRWDNGDHPYEEEVISSADSGTDTEMVESSAAASPCDTDPINAGDSPSCLDDDVLHMVAEAEYYGLAPGCMRDFSMPFIFDAGPGGWPSQVGPLGSNIDALAFGHTAPAGRNDAADTVADGAVFFHSQNAC